MAFGEPAGVFLDMPPPEVHKAQRRALGRLIHGKQSIVWKGPVRRPRAVLPGSFWPLHAGHRAMAELGRRRIGEPVVFELSVRNVDKPSLTVEQILQRLRQFDSEQTVCVTAAATFEEKARLFGECTFLVGLDTIVRLADPAYYGGSSQELARALRTIGDRACRFLVFGRQLEGRFMTLDQVELPAALRGLCQGVGGDEFRRDISSTEQRRRR